MKHPTLRRVIGSVAVVLAGLQISTGIQTHNLPTIVIGAAVGYGGYRLFKSAGSNASVNNKEGE